MLTAAVVGLAAACGASRPPGATPGPARSSRFVSARQRGAEVGWRIAYPPGAAVGAVLPVLVVLHGRGANHATAFDDLHLDRFLAAAGMVTAEFVPLLRAHGLDVRRIGLLGWSMGGYGALYLAGVLGAARVAVAVAESPALWTAAGLSAAGASDDAADFDRHAILGREARLAGIPLRIDCGADDGFAPVTRTLRARLHPTPAGGIEPGAHDAAYWRSQASAQLAYAGTHLHGAAR